MKFACARPVCCVRKAIVATIIVAFNYHDPSPFPLDSLSGAPFLLLLAPFIMQRSIFTGNELEDFHCWTRTSGRSPLLR